MKVRQNPLWIFKKVTQANEWVGVYQTCINVVK